MTASLGDLPVLERVHAADEIPHLGDFRRGWLRPRDGNPRGSGGFS
jgi:hypothetical protein